MKMKKLLSVVFLFSLVANFAFIAPNINAMQIPEGAIIKTEHNPDVYIVKYKNGKQFKRLVLNPQVFESYGHLRWEDILIVSQSIMNSFTESTLVRSDGESNVYKLVANGDLGNKALIETGYAYDPDSVYTINNIDSGNYVLKKLEELAGIIDELQKQIDDIKTEISTPKVDFCNNIEGDQAYVPTGMYRTNEDCLTETIASIQTKPEIIEFYADKSVAYIDESITLTWKTESATVCAIVENKNINIPFVGHLPNGDLTLILKESNDQKVPIFNYYAICADNDWNITTKQISIEVNYDWQIIPHFDTNDSWSAGNANDKCGLNLSYDSEINGGIPDYSYEQKIWPDKTVFSTLQLNVGNSENLYGVFLNSITLEKQGSANLSDINLSLELREGENFKSLSKTIVNENTVIFSSPYQEGIKWPFELFAKIDPNGMNIGETIGFSITNINFISNNDNDKFTFPNGLPVKSESPDLVIRCERSL